MKNPSNESWLKRLKQSEVADATYVPDSHPIVMEKAYGDFIYDVTGRKYLDFCGGFGALSFGHAPDFMQKLFQTYSAGSLENPPPLLHGLGDLYPSTAKILLEESLLSVLPPRFTRVSLAVTGAQAAETALKTALLYSGGSIFLAFKGAYHGVDFGTLRVTESSFFKQGFESWCSSSGTAQSHWLPLNCDIEDIKRIIFESHKSSERKLAGIIIEPIQGRAGIHVAEPAWLHQLVLLAKENDLPLIFDEIYCGMGRTGRITYADEFEADIVCFGKAMGAGMPISAIAGHEKIMAAWPSNTGEARHTGTFFGHPLSASCATNVLQRISQPELIQHITTLGKYFNQSLQALAAKASNAIQVRGMGLMQGIDFGSPGKGAQAMDNLRQKGVIGLAAGETGECLMFTPAFTTTQDHIKQVVSALEEILTEV